ncbi:MAG: SET domain-containing protein [Candidatus Tectimicrobiota bacterium]
MIRIGPSPIAGQGLFATQLIPQGSRILEYIGEKISKQESARRLAAHNNYIFHLNYRYDIDGQSLENTARYINHSCDPNCEIEKVGEQIWILALRDIQIGEELSFNYGYDAQEYEKFPCHCGARVCCGYILGREYWGLIKP